jgi:hypothetical protein
VSLLNVWPVLWLAKHKIMLWKSEPIDYVIVLNKLINKDKFKLKKQLNSSDEGLSQTFNRSEHIVLSFSVMCICTVRLCGMLIWRWLLLYSIYFCSQLFKFQHEKNWIRNHKSSNNKKVNWTIIKILIL